MMVHYSKYDTDEYNEDKRTMYRYKKRVAKKKFGGMCFGCYADYEPFFAFHHTKYMKDEKNYSDFSDTVYYNLYVLPIVEKNPERFRLLCDICHERTEKRKHVNFIDHISDCKLAANFAFAMKIANDAIATAANYEDKMNDAQKTDDNIIKYLDMINKYKSIINNPNNDITFDLNYNDYGIIACRMADLADVIEDINRVNGRISNTIKYFGKSVGLELFIVFESDIPTEAFEIVGKLRTLCSTMMINKNNTIPDYPDFWEK